MLVQFSAAKIHKNTKQVNKTTKLIDVQLSIAAR